MQNTTDFKEAQICKAEFSFFLESVIPHQQGNIQIHIPKDKKFYFWRKVKDNKVVFSILSMDRTISAQELDPMIFGYQFQVLRDAFVNDRLNQERIFLKTFDSSRDFTEDQLSDYVCGLKDLYITDTTQVVGVKRGTLKICTEIQVQGRLFHFHWIRDIGVDSSENTYLFNNQPIEIKNRYSDGCLFK